MRRDLPTDRGWSGVLASPAVRRIGLFDAALQAVGLRAVYPEGEADLLAAIRAIKAQGATPQARAALQSASARLLDAGARVQMIACTEFSLIPDAVADGAEAYDTLDLLVGAIRDFSLGKSA